MTPMLTSEWVSGGAGKRCLARLAALSCMCMALTACGQGYPTEDEALLLHHGLSREETLVAMNLLGSRKHLDQRWSYELTAQCELVIGSKHGVDTGQLALVALKKARTLVIKDAAGRAFDVVVQMPQESGEVRQVVLRGTHWVDASQMKWLLEYAPTHCTAAKEGT